MKLTVTSIVLTLLYISVQSLPTTELTKEESVSSTLSTASTTIAELEKTSVSDVTIDDEEKTDTSVTDDTAKEVRRVPKASGADEETPSADQASDAVETESNIAPSDDVIVETNSGDVDGFKQTVLGKTINTFLGIPYASPPIGDLRFKLPELIKPWRRPYKAHNWPPLCEQSLPKNIMLPSKRLTEQMSEDCLYLNIWTPSLDKENLKPVMVWFHGGYFSYGSAVNKENDGKVLASHGDVVVVTFNYRLSAYGFLNLEVHDAPGNMGLFDQHMAMKWIHANIQEFGGDPDQITVFGQGAGAFSIGLHIASPLTRNLFKRAILESGSPVQLSFLFEQQLNTSERLVDSLGCNNEDKNLAFTEPNEALSCIKTQPTNSLKDAINDVFNDYPLSFVPSKGDKMFPVSVIEMFADPTYYFDQQKEILLGINKDDGSLFLHYAIPEVFGADKLPILNTKEETQKMLDKLIESKLPLPDSLKNHVSKFVLAHSPDNYTDARYYTEHLYEIFTDNMIACPVVSYAKNFASIPEKSVYLYNFTHRASGNKYADWIGVNTYEEVQFVFGVPVEYPDQYTSDEVEFSKRMMDTWVHFAKTGTPLAQMGKEWPKYDPTSKEHMVLDVKSAEIGTGMNKNCRLFDFALNTDEFE